MSFQKRIRIPILILCLVILAGLTGCATGSSGSGRSRGSLSSATAEAAGKEEKKGRGQGQSQTRTKNDHLSSDNEKTYDDSDYDYYEDESDDGGWFLGDLIVGLFLSIFSGGDDDEPEEEYKAPLTDYSQSGNRTWSNQDEFGLSGEEESGGNEPEEDSYDGPDTRRNNANFWYSGSRLAGDTVDRFTTYTFMSSWYTGSRTRAHAGFYWGSGKTGTQANVREGLRWISEAGLDLGTRGYLTPRHSLLGFYVIAGLRVGAMYWSYNVALESVDDEGNPESISHDGLVLFVPYVGLGTSLLQTKSVHLGVNFTVGGRVAVDKTFRDYENDIFKSVGEYKLNIEASIFF